MALACCGRSSCTQRSALSPDEGTWTRCVTLDIGSRRQRHSLRHFGNHSVAARTQLKTGTWPRLAGGRRCGHAADSAGRQIAQLEMISGCLPKTPHVTACAASAYVGLAPVAQLLYRDAYWQAARSGRAAFFFCVLPPSPASIGCTRQLLRLREHIYALRTKTPSTCRNFDSEAAAELPLSLPNDSGRCTPVLD